MKAIKSETINFRGRKLCPNVVRDFTEFTTEPSRKSRKIVDIAKKGRGKDLRYGS